MSSDYKLRHWVQVRVRPEDRIHVLLQFNNKLPEGPDMGLHVTSVAGDVAAVSIPAQNLDLLKSHPDVVYVEASRSLKDETDVSSVAIGLSDPETGSRLVPGGGRGAIIGVIDSGFDLTHPCFLDAQGKTRILSAWDQVGGGGSPPTGFDYGVEYTRQAIGARAAARSILVIKNHPMAGAHGTYIAGIAAGNGRPHGIYKGIAPEAELVLVAYRNDVPVGGSAFVLDAIHYISEVARAAGRPAVINISQGDNLGAHDGTSLLERAIDNLSGGADLLVVTSAGNERGGPACHHARGEVAKGQEAVLPFALTNDAGHPVDGDTIEVWYRRGDRFAVALRSPDGRTSELVPPGEDRALDHPAGGRAHVYSELAHPTNGDNHIGVILGKGDRWQDGTWGLVLRGEEVTRGDFDAWSDRPNGVTVIGFEADKEDSCTVTLPGNARRAVTVGSFVSRREVDGEGAGLKGGMAAGSSIGPTRDGRVKPDLTAPGSLVMAPRMRQDESPTSYDMMAGTSVAAPHVSGVIALLWGLWPRCPADLIRTALYSSARRDQFTGATPNTSWGRGKLDASAAYKALSILIEKGETSMANNRVYEFETEPQPRPKSGPAGMSIRIEVKEDSTVVVRGTSGGEEYEGTLILRKKDMGVDGTLGGDECYINGKWYNPCPIGGGSK